MQLLNSIQEEILSCFGGIPGSQDFYLTGGTALSYFYLKHRKSNDLDFFSSQEELIFPFSLQLEEFLKTKGLDIQRQRSLRSFIELQLKKAEEATIIHLAQDAAFRFEPTRQHNTFPNVRIDSLTDIASNKLLTLFGRAMLRDFIDIYFLVKEGAFTAEILMEKAKMKDSGFDLYWLGVALERINTFKADSPEMLLLAKPVKFIELADFFNQWRENIIKQL